MKKYIAYIMTLCILLSLCGCGSSNQEKHSGITTQDKFDSADASNQNTTVEKINFSVESGSVQYTGWEHANDELTEANNAILVKFAFTNLVDKPSQFQQSFFVRYYQNGVELSDHPMYSSNGGEQYTMVNKFFDTAMKGGTIEFANIVVPKDNTPITIMVEQQGSFGKNYQMMELDISKDTETIVVPITEANAAEEDEHTVDAINFHVQDGSIAYVGWEKAHPELTDYDNAILMKFAYTNQQDKPSMVHQTFRLKYYQNGAELSENPSYSSNAKEQYELARKFFDTALKGGTITFADIIVPEDDSPITIMVEENGVFDSDYQTMILDLAEGTAAEVIQNTAENNAANAPNKIVGAQQPVSQVDSIQIGDTIETPDFDFTLDNVEFTYELKPENTSSVYVSYEAPRDKVYIHIDGRYYNKAKKDVCIRDLFTPTADYDDGYIYNGFALVDRDDNSFFWVDSYVVCTPLETCHYHGLIECPQIVESQDKPLFVTMNIGGQEYRYDIR